MSNEEQMQVQNNEPDKQEVKEGVTPVDDKYEELLKQGKQVLDSIPAVHSIPQDLSIAQRKEPILLSFNQKFVAEGQQNIKKQIESKDGDNHCSGQSKIGAENESKEGVQGNLSMIKKSSRLFVGCNCIKSKCTKNYCECFTQGRKCNELCKCTNCENQGQTQKKYRSAFQIDQIERNCNCKKSNCLKKYCECFNSGVKCNINCKCEDCKNSFDDPLQVQEDAQEVKEEGKKVRSAEQINEINAKIDQIAKLVPQEHQQYVLSFLEYWLS